MTTSPPSSTTTSPSSSSSMYQLICRQLQEDGYHDLAMQLAVRADITPDPSIPPNRLLNLLSSSPSSSSSADRSAPAPPVAPVPADASLPSRPSFPDYHSPFVTTHKAPVRASCFHRDSTHLSTHLLATGSDDSTIKVFSVDSILSSPPPSSSSSSPSSDPLLRTYYDHSDPITSLHFHPTEPFLISTSTDCSIKFFQYSNPSYRRAYLALHDAFAVRDAAVHPSGDWLLAATDHPILRLYDLHTLQCFISPESGGQHSEAIRSVDWTFDGSCYASASSDGHVKLFDSRLSHCIHTLSYAHSHQIVNSVKFSPDGQSLLTCGRDNTAKLWDVGSGRLLVKYEGAQHSEGSTPAVFDSLGQWVLSGDDAYGMIVVWEVEGGEVRRRLAGHSKPIRTLSADKEEELFVSGGEDGRVRVWSAGQGKEENENGE